MVVPYGNYFGSDVLYNIRVGKDETEVSFRFIAKGTVLVNQIKYFNTYSFARSGYHLGSGGKIRIELQTDDGTEDHNPSGDSLAFALIPDPLNVSKQFLVDFDDTVLLEEDEIYHIVFTNYDDNPETNYVSVNTMSILKPKEDLDAPDQPELSLIDMTVLIRNSFNASWRRFKSNKTITPVFSLFHDIPSLGFTNISVPGYSGMESWIREPRQIQGDDYKVRQRFVPNRNIDVENVCVRLAKNGNPELLYAKLWWRDELITQGSVDSSEVDPVEVISEFTAGHNWVTIDFFEPVELEAKKIYYLELSAAAGDPYKIYPVRDGYYGFNYAPIWSNAWAEYTMMGDEYWKGWDAWGNSNLRISQLQLYFNASN